MGDPGDPRRGVRGFAGVPGKLLPERGVLDVLLGEPAKFGRANVLNSG